MPYKYKAEKQALISPLRLPISSILSIFFREDNFLYFCTQRLT